MNQKKFKAAVRSETSAGGGAKEKRKKGGAEALPQVSRVQVEEVDSNSEYLPQSSVSIPPPYFNNPLFIFWTQTKTFS